MQLEQLESQRSEDIPRRPMITHTIYQLILDPKSKQNKLKITNKKHAITSNLNADEIFY